MCALYPWGAIKITFANIIYQNTSLSNCLHVFLILSSLLILVPAMVVPSFLYFFLVKKPRFDASTYVATALLLDVTTASYLIHRRLKVGYLKSIKS